MTASWQHWAQRLVLTSPLIMCMLPNLPGKQEHRWFQTEMLESSFDFQRTFVKTSVIKRKYASTRKSPFRKQKTCRGASNACNARMIWSRSASSQRKHPGLRCERPSQEKLRSSQSEVRGWGMSPSLPSARSPCSNNNPNCRVLTDVALRVDDALACHGSGAGWAMLWGVKAGWCCHYWHQDWHQDCDFVSQAQKSLIIDHAMGFGSVYMANPDKLRCRGVRGWFDGEEQQIRF